MSAYSIPSRASDSGPLPGAPKRPVDYIEDAIDSLTHADHALCMARKDAYEGYDCEKLLRTVVTRLKATLDSIESAKAAAL